MIRYLNFVCSYVGNDACARVAISDNFKPVLSVYTSTNTYELCAILCATLHAAKHVHVSTACTKGMIYM